MYRMPRYLAMEFLDSISGYMQGENTCPEIPLTVQFCSVLNFFASGSYQRRVGSDGYAMLSQTVVSRCIRSFSYVIATKMMDQYIQFPNNIEEIETLHDELQSIADFPGAFAIVDGSHIELTALSRDIEYAFVNRKGSHSINTQFVVDARMRILSVNARYPGSTHDSLIWRSSLVNSNLRKMANRMGRNFKYFLLADHGYPLQPWILKPYDSPSTWTQINYNIRHRQLRSLIERVLGLLKARFRCCLKERKLRYDPLTSGYIIYSCAVLHNFLIGCNYPIDDIEPIFEDEINNFDEDQQIDYNELRRGCQVRNDVAEYFANN